MDDKIVEEAWFKLNYIPRGRIIKNDERGNPERFESIIKATVEFDGKVWKAGTPIKEIREWFGKQHSKGYDYLMELEEPILYSVYDCKSKKYINKNFKDESKAWCVAWEHWVKVQTEFEPDEIDILRKDRNKILDDEGITVKIHRAEV